MPPRFQRRLSHRLREVVGPYIDRAAHALGEPATRVRSSEYAGTAHCNIADLEAALADAGFHWDPVSLYHFTPLGTPTDGSWVYRESPFGHRQLHVVLFAQSDERVDCYAHDEYNWVRHPIRHARHEDIRREAGSTEMRDCLAELDIETSQTSVIVRKVAHAVEKLRNPRSKLADLPVFGRAPVQVSADPETM